MKTIRISTVVIIALLISTASFAQRGRGYNNHYQSNHHYNNYHGYPRSTFSVNVGPRYNYRPSYRPYYNYSPAYRPIVRPVYRSPRPYIPYGPAFGFHLSVLPFGYSRIYVGPNPYYYNEGVYYRPYSNGGGYEVVEPPLNATVTKLPANAIVTVIDGQKYYQLGGTFYQEEIDENNKVSYRVVGTDGVINTESATNDEENMTTEENMNAPEENMPATEETAPAPAPAPILGSRYDELPAGSKVQVINQQKYFVSGGGVYYKEVIEGDKIRYEVTTVE